MEALLDRLLNCLEYEKEDPTGAVEGSERTLQLIQALGRTKPCARTAATPDPREASRPLAAPASQPTSVAATSARPAPAPKPRPKTDATRPPTENGERNTTMETIADQVRACVQCDLHKTRTKAVPGQGSSSPEIAFVGEAPGADEDQAGLAFVGRAGQLLTQMIEAMGYTRDDVFIGNILKCRPPDNRTPTPAEMAVCSPYLREQLKRLRPKIIVALGATAIRGLLPDIQFEKMGDVRGQWQSYEGIPVMPTFHPAYLLRTQKAKAPVWKDLKTVLARLGKTPPPVEKSS